MKKPARIATLTVLLATAASCAPQPPAEGGSAPLPGREPVACPVIASRDWNAWVDAMPGPNAARTLHVTGVVDLPTPGYRVELIPGPTDRMMPPGQRLSLVATPPAGMAAQVVTATPVRFEGPALADTYREILIGCGGSTLVRIARIDTAR